MDAQFLEEGRHDIVDCGRLFGNDCDVEVEVVVVEDEVAVGEAADESDVFDDADVIEVDEDRLAVVQGCRGFVRSL